MSDYYHGELLARRDHGRVVVVRADPVVLATNELVEEWRAGNGAPDVHMDGDVATFGTEGWGVGRVSYRIGGHYDQHTYVMTRVDHEGH